MTGEELPVISSLDSPESLLLFWALWALFLGGTAGRGICVSGVPDGMSGRVLSNKNKFYVIIFTLSLDIFYIVTIVHEGLLFIKVFTFILGQTKLNCTFISGFFRFFSLIKWGEKESESFWVPPIGRDPVLFEVGRTGLRFRFFIRRQSNYLHPFQILL